MLAPPISEHIEHWPIDRFVFYARNPRKNDAAVDRMCARLREFSFKIPVLARSDGEVVGGHLRLKAARKLGSWPWMGIVRCSYAFVSHARTLPGARIMFIGFPL